MAAATNDHNLSFPEGEAGDEDLDALCELVACESWEDEPDEDAQLAGEQSEPDDADALAALADDEDGETPP